MSSIELRNRAKEEKDKLNLLIRGVSLREISNVTTSIPSQNKKS
jgi:hypothetical protein